MSKVDPQIMTDARPEVYTEQSYLDIFPKENIVYLSPDSRNELKWDDEDVYVIGGLVDIDVKSNASLGKAKREGVRHAHLPMRRVLGKEHKKEVQGAQRGGALCVQMDFTMTFQTNTKCNNISKSCLKLFL